MKTHSVLAALLLSLSLAYGQQQGGGGQPAGGQSTGRSGNTSGQNRQRTTPSTAQQPSSAVNQNEQQPNTPNAPNTPNQVNPNQNPNQNVRDLQPGESRERVLLDTQNRSQQNPQQFGTNNAQNNALNRRGIDPNTQGRFGTTNPAFGTQNPSAIPGANSSTPFGQSRVNADGSVGNNNGGAINAPGGTAAASQTAADQAFNQRLGAALLQTGSTQVYFPLTRSTISVQNVNGVVTLQGNVANQTEQQSIEARVKQMQGVTRVVNQLQLNNAANSAAGSTGKTNIIR